MDEDDVAGFLSAFASAAEPVDVHFLWRPRLSDPDDELVLECALNGRAQALITHNVRDFKPAIDELGVAVMTPAAFLKRMST
jgi:predicted nucleic acid-binding protein